MTDQELESYLGLTPEEAAIIIPRLTPEKRATYERMHEVESELMLWQKAEAIWREVEKRQIKREAT